MINIFNTRGFTGENAVSTIMVISLIGLVIPYGIPLYPLLLIFVLLYFLLIKNIFLKINILSILVYVSFLLYFVGILFNSGRIYQKNIDDIFNIFTTICFLMIIGKLDILSFNAISKKFMKYLTYFFPVIALVSLLKFYFQQNGRYITFLHFKSSGLPYGTSLKEDYNMYSLGFCIALIGLMYFYKNTTKGIYRLYYLVSIVLCSLSIGFSGSRRGLVVLILLSVWFIGKELLSTFRNLKLKNYNLLFVMFIIITTIQLFSGKFISSESLEYRKIIARYESLVNFSQSYSGRTDRWLYGIEIFKEYDFINILIGKGFTYIELYAGVFTYGISEDYPHNPIISALLYSGIIGAILIIIIVFYPIIIYFNKKNMIGIEMLLIYIISLTFLLSSGNSIFSNNFLLLLICIAFSINKIKILQESS